MQTRPTASILARVRTMLRSDKRTVEARRPPPVVPEPRPAPTPVAAEQPSAKEI